MAGRQTMRRMSVLGLVARGVSARSLKTPVERPAVEARKPSTLDRMGVGPAANRPGKSDVVATLEHVWCGGSQLDHGQRGRTDRRHRDLHEYGRPVATARPLRPVGARTDPTARAAGDLVSTTTQTCSSGAAASGATGRPGPTSVVIVENAFAGRLGSARNTALLECQASIVAFLDDDAEAEPDWLDRLLAVYSDPVAVAVGGAPRPNYGAPRPRWFPADFDWVFRLPLPRALPDHLAPVRHLIGANMSVPARGDPGAGWLPRRQPRRHGPVAPDRARLRVRRPWCSTQPRAEVRHFVAAERLTWAYFWRRCLPGEQGQGRCVPRHGLIAGKPCRRRGALRLWGGCSRRSSRRCSRR